jgi:AraC-like DNA-binding protein
MISTGYNVETACFEVGYESPSQFSREYARMFGTPPKRDAKRVQTAIQRDRAAAGRETAIEDA